MHAGNKLSQKQTQQQIYDSEKRAMLYNRKYQKIQADYQNLIGIAADLIDSLELSVQGHSVSFMLLSFAAVSLQRDWLKYDKVFQFIFSKKIIF